MAPCSLNGRRAVCRRMSGSGGSVRNRRVRRRQMADSMTVEVRQMQLSETLTAEHKRKEAEAEADRETD